MKKTRSFSKIILAVFAVFLLSMPFVSPAPAATTMVLTPSTQTVDPGDTFTVDIVVTPDRAIAGVQFDINWNPDLLEFDGWTEGDLLNQDPPGCGTFVAIMGGLYQEQGFIDGLAGVVLGSGCEVSGPGIYVTLTFTAEAAGISPLVLSDVIVGDLTGTEVPSTVTSGDVVITGTSIYINHLGIDDQGNDYFPQEQAQELYCTGAASGLQALRFFDDSYSWPGQVDLYNTYHTGTPGEDMNESDLAWMLTDQTNQNPDTARYNFIGFSDSDQDHAIKRMIYWIDYEVPDVAETNAPAHVPTDGSYSNNWKTVRGFVSNKDPWVDWQMPSDLEFYGAWLNDPKATGMGYNVYQTGDEFRNIYQATEGSWCYVAEPPQDVDMDELDAALDSINITYVESKPDQELASALDAKKDLDVSSGFVAMSRVSKSKIDIEPKEIEEVFKEVNWDKVIPVELYTSPDFINIYSQSRLSGAMNVIDLESGEDYDLILFSQSKVENTASVALMVKGETGTFRQASWSLEDQKYLAEEEALKIAQNALGFAKKAIEIKHGEIKPLPVEPVEPIEDWKIRLIWDKGYNQSRFRPIYEVSVSGGTVYVLQDGSFILAGQ